MLDLRRYLWRSQHLNICLILGYISLEISTHTLHKCMISEYIFGDLITSTYDWSKNISLEISSPQHMIDLTIYLWRSQHLNICMILEYIFGDLNTYTYAWSKNISLEISSPQHMIDLTIYLWRSQHLNICMILEYIFGDLNTYTYAWS